ncbi:MAG: FAD-binding domain-containing protein [Burkholderiales bacterium]
MHFMSETYSPTLAAAQARIAAVQPSAYARTRNAIDGAVSGLSPYITHGLVSLSDVLAGVAARHELAVQHKFVYELGWRAYFRHVWQHRGENILQSLHDGPLPDAAYAVALPADIRFGCTDVPVINQAVRTLYATGMLHNHARMWLASYVVHLRKVHWRCGADWLYGHLLDGDLASNHLSWQWVAGTGSHKPYLFNAENVARYAPASWHSPGSLIDASYETLDRVARQPKQYPPAATHQPPEIEPPLLGEPPAALGAIVADPELVKGREVWLVHPWNLGTLPALPQGTLVLGLFVGDFHRAWPWSDRRWRFVDARMAELTPHRWYDDAAAIGAALAGAKRVRSVDEPHLAPWLARWAECIAAPALFPQVARRCDSFSQWWNRASRGLQSAADLLNVNKAPAW